MEIVPIDGKDSVDARKVNDTNATAIVTSKLSKRPTTAQTIRAGRALAGKTKATTTTVTKITKLVLKPRAEQKSRFTLTTTQHFSRQTAMSSSAKPPSHLDKTYRIQNINVAKRVSVYPAKGVGRAWNQNKPKTVSKENVKSIEPNKQESIVKSKAVSQMKQTNTLNNGVLEEITSAVVNASPKKPTLARNSMAFEIQNTPKKRIKSTEAANAEKSADKCKRKSYDPIKARQFIREQQEKRKLSAQEKAKATANQEEIKKRLDNLRRNSLKIVNKNVSRARSTTSTVDSGKIGSRRKLEMAESKKVIESVDRRPSNAVSLQMMSQQSHRERIGILRRPDGSAVAPSPAALTTPLPRSNNTRNKISPQPALRESPAPAGSEKPKTPPKSETKMDLQMPLSMSLKSSLLMTNLSTPNDDRNNEMRFWLRPTPVQPYPYNFIMAVRKKLELVTHPVLRSSSEAVKSQSTPIGRRHLEEPRKLSLAHELVAADQSKSHESLNSETITRATRSESEQRPRNSSYSEEYSTNFSSVTLKTLERSRMQANDMLSSTKITSPRLPVANEDSQDTLSMSSGILSHSSPEKKRTIQTNNVASIERQPTPLSTNHTDNLHIVSRSISQHSSTANGQTQADEPLDVQKMLNDFNQSLSQVIRVNKQLRTALSNPPSLRAASASEQQPTSTEEYSDDVDNFGSDRPTNENTAIEGKTPSTATPSEQIGTEGESIPESITATPSDLERRQSSTIKDSDFVKSSMAEEVPTTASVRTSDEMQTLIDDGSQSQPQSTRSYQKRIFDEREVMNTSIGSDIFTILKQTAAIDLNSSTWSDGNVSYSNLGMCEQLIHAESQKTEHLASLLKLREKSLIDRFKGQIVWLELQKQKLKAKGMTTEISAVKKKQRALLVRLDKDRKELHRLMKLHQKPTASTEVAPNVNYKISHLCTNMNIRRTSMSTKQYVDGASPMQAMKAIELPGNSNLEMMLQKRENELRLRREHVEKLLNWHQRLDVEEQEIMKMEQMVMMLTTATTNDTYTGDEQHVQNDNLAITVHRSHTKAITANQQQQQPNDSQRECVSSSNNTSMQMNEKREKHIRKIEKSLQMLHNISARSVSSDTGAVDSNNDDEQRVEVSGRQLNRLWKRLTGQFDEKFAAQQVYTLTKVDLEELYEEAKVFVLKKFHAIEINKLINNSIHNSSSVLGEFDQSPLVDEVSGGDKNVTTDKEAIVVPALELNHSSSTEDVSTKLSTQEDADQGYYFSSDTTADNKLVSRVPTLTSSKASIVDEEIDEEIKGSTEDQNSGADGGITPNTYHDSEDMHSDITEDSLNKTKIASQQSETTIESAIESASQIDESVLEVASSTTPVNETTQLIEDISFPHIDVTVTLNKSESIDDEQKYSSDDFEKTKSEAADDSNGIETERSNESQHLTRSTSPLSPTIKSKELEQRLIDLDDSLKDLNETISRSPVLGMRSDSASPDIDTPSEEIRSILNSAEPDEISEEVHQKSEPSESSTSTAQLSPPTLSAPVIPLKLIDAKAHPDLVESLPSPPTPKYTNSFIIDYNKMPEAEALRRTPVSVDTAEKTTLDQSTSISFPFLREIPNKPPPPYPTHRHPPKTTLPSDERIKEIVFQRIERLHSGFQESPVDDKTFIKSPSQIIKSQSSPTATAAVNETNAMFERIIVDVCEEIMTEYQLDQKNPSLGKQPIAFYKPPDRLQCLQEHAWRRIKKLLGRPNGDAATKAKANGTNGVQLMNARCLPSQMANMTCNNRRKRDMVDEILIHELYEDEPKWTNFDLEELEVRNNVKDLSSLLADEPSIEENQTEDAEGDSSSTNESKSTPDDGVADANSNTN